MKQTKPLQCISTDSNDTGTVQYRKSTAGRQMIGRRLIDKSQMNIEPACVYQYQPTTKLPLTVSLVSKPCEE